MKKALKVTSVICIIFGIHYIAIGIFALFAAGFGAIATLATFSAGALGVTISEIFALALCLFMAYIYGMSGIQAIKGNKKPALINIFVALIISIILLIISLVSKRVSTSFLDVVAVILPIMHMFFIVQSAE